MAVAAGEPSYHYKAICNKVIKEGFKENMFFKINENIECNAGKTEFNSEGTQVTYTSKCMYLVIRKYLMDNLNITVSLTSLLEIFPYTNNKQELIENEWEDDTPMSRKTLMDIANHFNLEINIYLLCKNKGVDFAILILFSITTKIVYFLFYVKFFIL